MSSSVPTEICSLCLRTVKIIPTHLFPGFDKLCLLWKENAPTTNIAIARCARGGASGRERWRTQMHGTPLQRCSQRWNPWPGQAQRTLAQLLGRPWGTQLWRRVHPLWPVTWRCDHRAERNLEETCLCPGTHTHWMVESLNLLNTEAWAHRIFHTLSLLIALIVNWQPL